MLALCRINCHRRFGPEITELLVRAEASPVSEAAPLSSVPGRCKNPVPDMTFPAPLALAVRHTSPHPIF
jgi:hypothetical protein